MAATSAPLVHSVYFYDTNDALIQRLVGIATSALLSGNSVLMVVTADHAAQLAPFFTPRLLREGQESLRLSLVDAEVTLTKFMVNGRPDGDRFFATVTKLVDEASISAHATGGKVTVFGEMVAVLWSRGEREAALELERLWNTALQNGRFYLHCAYAKQDFTYDADQSAIVSVCNLHSHAFGTADAAL